MQVALPYAARFGYGIGRYLARAAGRRLYRAATNPSNYVRAANVAGAVDLAGKAARGVTGLFGGSKRRASAGSLRSMTSDMDTGEYYSTPHGGTSKLINKRNRSVSFARHAGFIKGYRRSGKSYRRRKRQVFRGIQFNNEIVGTVSDDRCVYVGHHDSPMQTLAKYLTYALFKALMNKGGIEFSSFNSFCAGSIGTGDIIGIELRLTPLAAITAFSITVPTVTSTTTFGSVAEQFWVSVFDNLIVGTGTPGGANGVASSRLLKLYWNKAALGGNQDQINLSDCNFDWMIKSALKMQNRSINTVEDDESTDVNNVPLIGKTYQFKGNVMLPNDTQDGAVFLPPDNSNGLMAFGAGSNSVLQEPPEAYFFQGKPKFTKVSIAPGGIKTSVLTSKKSMNISAFYRFCNGLYRSVLGSNPLYNPMGASRMFGLERTIARQAGETSPGIQVAYEHDIKYWLSVNYKSSKVTQQINIVA